MLPLSWCKHALVLTLSLWSFGLPASADAGMFSRPYTVGYGPYGSPYWGGYTGYTGISYPMTIGPPASVTSFYGSSWGMPVTYSAGFGASYNPCGCSPCAAPCGGCAPCGSCAPCGTGGCASGNCAGGDCGVSYSPQSNEPVPEPKVSQPEPTTPRQSTPPTYRDPPADRFVPVEPRDQNRSSIPNTNQPANNPPPNPGIDASPWDLPRTNEQPMNRAPMNRSTDPREPSINDDDGIFPVNPNTNPNAPRTNVEPLELEPLPVASHQAFRGRVVTQTKFQVPSVVRIPVSPRVEQPQTQVAKH